MGEGLLLKNYYNSNNLSTYINRNYLLKIKMFKEFLLNLKQNYLFSKIKSFN